MSTNEQKTSLRALILEDSEFDAQVLVNTLRQGGYRPQFQRVDTADALRQALASGPWDMILSDYNMPSFNAPEALQIVQQSGLDVPFIIISGGIGEDVAVAAMKAGAHDYLMKGHLARLVPAVERELREAATRTAKRLAEEALRESEQRYRLLWENSTDAVVLMDRQAVIQFANPAVEDIFGTRAADLVGQGFACLLTEGERSRCREWLDQRLALGAARKRQQPIETVGRRIDGQEIIIEIGFANVDLHSGLSVVAFIRDISARRRVEQELRENEEQFRVAREIQQRLFPKTAPAVPGFDIAGISNAADAAGGDYFDYVPMLNGRLGIVIGDVTGHGIGPALLMAETRAYLRVLARNREDTGEILTRANRVLAEDIGYERFITMLLMSLDPQTRALTFANAGHPTGFVLDASGQIKGQLKRTGIPLGIKHDTVYPAGGGMPLATGDIVLLLTDGIGEAMSPEDAIFGDDRTLDLVRKHRHETAREIVDALYREVREFARNAPQLDDATAVVVKVL